MARGIMVAHELCVLCRNVVWVFAVKCERFQPLCAYYMEQTVCNRDCAHTQITSQGCELLMSVSSGLSDSYANKCRKPPFSESGNGPGWREYGGLFARASTPDSDSRRGDRSRVDTDMTSRCFTHFPVSGTSRVRNEDTPPPAPSGASQHLFNLGVDWWRTRRTEESQASALPMGNRMTWIQLACEFRPRCYSHLNFYFCGPRRPNGQL